MKLFYAGTGSPNDFYGDLKNYLFSYANLKSSSSKFWDNPKLKNKNLFLDSGAFSAFTRDVEINLKEYVKYIKEHEDKFYCYAALDVIGDWKKSQLNFVKMRELGTKPIPAFHYGSPLRALEWYCEKKVPFIALGGLVPMSKQRQKLKAHLDRCWSVLKNYWPIKVHCFGLISQHILENYPFYSCDSTSLAVAAGVGDIMIFKNGKLKRAHWKVKGKKGEFPILVDNLHKPGSQHEARRYNNAEQLLKYEKYITELWQSRGISWSD